jgi:hypothetical protein
VKQDRMPRSERPLSAIEQCAVAFAVVLIGVGAYTLTHPAEEVVVFPQTGSRQPGDPFKKVDRDATWALSPQESKAFSVLTVIIGVGIAWVVLSRRSR